MVHDKQSEHFDKMWKIAKELRVYKRKLRREILQKLFLVALIVALVVMIVTGFDAGVREAVSKLFNNGKALAK